MFILTGTLWVPCTNVSFPIFSDKLLVGHGLTLSLYRAYLLGYPTVRFEDWQRLGFAAVALVDPVVDQLLQDFQPVTGHIACAD